MCNIQKETVERQLNENIDSISLLKETSCSFLYYVKGKKEYVLKKLRKKASGKNLIIIKKYMNAGLEKKKISVLRFPRFIF